MSDLPDHKVVVVLTAGKADNGKKATLAFSCGLASLAMGNQTALFLTSDGAVWGYTGSAQGIAVQGFPPLEELIEEYWDAGGRIVLCSVCHKTCGNGGPEHESAAETLPGAELGGFASILEFGMGGLSVTF